MLPLLPCADLTFACSRRRQAPPSTSSPAAASTWTYQRNAACFLYFNNFGEFLFFSSVDPLGFSRVHRSFMVFYPCSSLDPIWWTSNLMYLRVVEMTVLILPIKPCLLCIKTDLELRELLKHQLLGLNLFLFLTCGRSKIPMWNCETCFSSLSHLCFRSVLSLSA